MQTSQAWWSRTRSDPELLAAWLVKQHRGEVTAAVRVRAFAERFAPSERERRTLDTVARQEEQHAAWVLALLEARGIAPDLAGAEARYWGAVLPGAESFELGAAVGAHAEEMRLERIRVIVGDPEAPADVRAVFERILGEEQFHARAFREMAGEAAMSRTQGAHELGRALLGLEA